MAKRLSQIQNAAARRGNSASGTMTAGEDHGWLRPALFRSDGPAQQLGALGERKQDRQTSRDDQQDARHVKSAKLAALSDVS